MDEEFFNVEFWRSLIAVGLGALFGFGTALLGGLLLEKGRRRQFAKAVRNAIATECIHNLTALGRIDGRTQQTIDANFTTIYSYAFPPRGNVLQGFITPDVLGSLSTRERGALAVVGPELDHAGTLYDQWQRSVRDPAAQAASREAETRLVLHVVRTSGRNVLGLLINVCKAARGQLLDENARRMADKLAAAQIAPSPNFVRGLKSSHGKTETVQEIARKRRYLVVWEHDWGECPMDVIELQTCVDPAVIRYSD